MKRIERVLIRFNIERLLLLLKIVVFMVGLSRCTVSGAQVPGSYSPFERACLVATK